MVHPSILLFVAVVPKHLTFPIVEFVLPRMIQTRHPVVVVLVNLRFVLPQLVPVSLPGFLDFVAISHALLVLLCPSLIHIVVDLATNYVYH